MTLCTATFMNQKYHDCPYEVMILVNEIIKKEDI